MKSIPVPIPDGKTKLELHRLYKVLDPEQHKLPKYVGLEEADDITRHNPKILFNYGLRFVGTRSEIKAHLEKIKPIFVMYVESEDMPLVSKFRDFRSSVRTVVEIVTSGRFTNLPVFGYRCYEDEIMTNYQEPEMWNMFIKECQKSDFFRGLGTKLWSSLENNHQISSPRFEEELADRRQYMKLYGDREFFWQLPADKNYETDIVTQGRGYADTVITTGNTIEYVRLLNMITSIPTTPLQLWQIQMMVAHLENILHLDDRQYYVEEMSKYIKQYNSFLEESIRIEKFLWDSHKRRDQAEVIRIELLYQTPTVIATLTGLHNWQQREYIKAKARHVGLPLPGLSSYANKQVVFDNAYLNYKLITSIHCNTDYPPDATTADKIGVSKDISSSIEINELELPKLSPERIRELEAETDRMIGKPAVVKKSAYWVPPKEEIASKDIPVPSTEDSSMSFPTHRRLPLPLPPRKSTTPSSRDEFSTLIQDLSESKQENAAVWLSEQDERTPEEYQVKYNELTNPTTREEFYAMIQDLSDYKQEKAIIWLSEQDERTPEEYQAKYKELTTKLSIPRLPPRLPLIKRAGVASGR